ncbi:hypothetical protein HPDP_00328 [Candidatus Hepatincola sp. Pdp]
MKIFKIILVLILVALPLKAYDTYTCDAVSNKGTFKAELSDAAPTLIYITIRSLGILQGLDYKKSNPNIAVGIDNDRNSYTIYNKITKILKVKELSTKKTIQTIQLKNCTNIEDLN